MKTKILLVVLVITAMVASYGAGYSMTPECPEVVVLPCDECPVCFECPAPVLCPANELPIEPESAAPEQDHQAGSLNEIIDGNTR